MYDDEFPDDPGVLDSLERLVAVERFGAGLEAVPWFAHLGQPLLESDMQAAREYLDALGFAEIAIAPVEDWAQAAEAAENPGFGTTWWDAEEAERAALTVAALAVIEEGDFNLAFTRLAERAAAAIRPAAEEAAALAGFRDQSVIRAAAGAAVQTVHLRALVVAADAARTHPAVSKCLVYESGRWPISVVGQSFHVF